MTRRFNIAMIAACPFPYPRGTPIRIFKLAEALAQRGHRVHLVTYHLGEQTRQYPFKLHRTPSIKSYQKVSPGPSYQKLLLMDPLLAMKLFRVLQKNEIDVIHAHHYEGLLVAAAVKGFTNHPVIYDAHTMLHSELPFYGLGLSKKIKALAGYQLDRWLPGLADYTISVTDTIRDKLIEMEAVLPDRASVITNGVEEGHFDVGAAGSDPNGIEKKRLIFTGNLAAYQGIDLMLQAFHQVLDRRPDVYLRIVSASDFDTYEPLASSLKIREHIEIIKADFHGLARQLGQADIALNPRVACDGIPMKLLNYMAAGKPVVSFASSAKAVAHNQTGLVVEDGNIPAFAGAICQLLEDPALARQLGANAREVIKAHYTWEKMAEKTELIYEIVSSSRQPTYLQVGPIPLPRSVLKKALVGDVGQ